MGNKSWGKYDALVGRLAAWAKASPDIKLLMVIGSQARSVLPADEYSDLDLIVAAEDPGRLISSDHWLENIGSYWTTFTEKTPDGRSTERRVLFENALDVDFVIVSEEDVKRAIADKDSGSVLSRGFYVLYDGAGLSEILPRFPGTPGMSSPPGEGVFLNLVNDFWYHSAWSVKKLKRGELWMGKSCVDSYMKNLLLRMIEWHARALNGWDYDTWHGGRFLDTWAAQKVKERLPLIYSRYDVKDIARALLSTMDLFRALAVETAGKLNYGYPREADENISNWVRQELKEL